MKISVIIPAYNAEKWIAQCIECVLGQSWRELEVIVVDDGSTDRTAEIAAAYPVRLLRQENRGLSASRNRAIDEATGDWIHFMDADDWLNVDFYAAMADALVTTGADMAFGSFVHESVPRRSRVYSERWLVSAPEDKFTLTNAHKDGYSWRYVFRKALLERSGLRFEEGRIIEDLPFTARAVADAHSIVTVPGAVYYYKKRAGSIILDTDPDKKRRRTADTAHANALRDAIMSELGLARLTKLRTVERREYKILGIPLLQRRLGSDGRTRWLLLGLPVAQSKPKG